MKHQNRFTRIVTTGVLIAAAALGGGCTMKSQEAPPLAGPSEFGTSISIAVSPDVLTQDGASQSVVTVTARDSNGQPLRNLPLRSEINVDGVFADFGSLSARNIVTGSDGRATLVYTAPRAPAASIDTNTLVSIVVTPVGTDYNNAVPRLATIRLVPPGVVQVPSNLSPNFTISPEAPEDNQTVLFEACGSAAAPCAAANNPIASYNWSFGEGGTASGRIAQYRYSTAGTYVVSLTVTDGSGRTATTTRSVTVGASTLPTANFTFSPLAPRVGTGVSFNASSSFTTEPGRDIASYTWDFGDGSPLETTGNPIVFHAFGAPANYRVTLVVTDTAGRRSLGFATTIAIVP
jgi:PKD repeat protein